MRGCAKRDVLSCTHILPICSTCERVIKILFCMHALPCDPCTNAPQDILSCAHVLPLYFTCERAIRCILHFTHALRLYNILLMLLNIKLIRRYWWRAVCARIQSHAIFCAILHIYAPPQSDFYISTANFFSSIPNFNSLLNLHRDARKKSTNSCQNSSLVVTPTPQLLSTSILYNRNIKIELYAVLLKF